MRDQKTGKHVKLIHQPHIPADAPAGEPHADNSPPPYDEQTKRMHLGNSIQDRGN